MKTMNSQVLLIVLILTVLGMTLTTGCKPAECRQMARCCEEVKDMEGVGAACGSIAKDLINDKTCTSVLQTIGYMLEDKQLPVPEVCR